MRSQTKHRFIRISEVTSTAGLSRSHIYDLISKGAFPRQYKLGERASVRSLPCSLHILSAVALPFNGAIMKFEIIVFRD
jgi:hypothetical protein